MATILYKDGAESRVEAGQVQRMLAAGYSVENKPAEKNQMYVESDQLAAPEKSVITDVPHIVKIAGKRGRKRAQN